MISLSIGGDVKSLFKILRGLAEADHERDRERAQTYLNVLAGFARSGREEFLGLPLAQPSSLQSDPEQVCLTNLVHFGRMATQE